MNFRWLWITYKQLNIQMDFATWAIRNGLVNKELYYRKDEIDEYHIPKEINQKLLTMNYNTELYTKEELK